MEKSVHKKLPVSFFMVKSVVEQGQWKRENIMVQSAVFIVHPLLIKISPIRETDEISLKFPLPRYAIKAIGITISFAGKPRMNANKITPSNPIASAIGFKNSEQ